MSGRADEPTILTTPLDTERGTSRLVENAVAYIREVTISPSGAADRIIALCTQSVAESAADAIGDEDSTPGLESFLWNFWDTVINDIVFRESELHDRLVEILKWMKKRGRAGCRNWKVWGEDMDWTNLVLFGPNLRENFNGPQVNYRRYPRADALPWPEVYRILSGDTPSDLNNPLSTAYSDARTHWLNLCRFIMRLWAEDVSDFEVYGIWMMRAGLEDLDLSHPEDTSKEPSTTMAVTITLGIEEAGVCVQAAGAKMYKSSTIFGPHGNPDWKQSNAPGRGGIRWKGVDGYHTERWKLWKALFKEVIDAETTLRPRAIDAAKCALEVMEGIEADANLLVVNVDTWPSRSEFTRNACVVLYRHRAVPIYMLVLKLEQTTYDANFQNIDTRGDLIDE